ncbi:MAG: Dot/Icm secretion system protein IcmQ [Gammaproteobacteria bacterium RIFCSPLOWO2_02_FULL_42_14]|nr:MAG: Dot/Icm secretion system protein IcmQ [Gammaproteobacteria bacterium RIFCSPHIGHO2_02_FULL_42_43]OGT27963.1 MAG: Dot/Icm secretion system protein IcmQ [Gammaproteobacteria bacterium RIFCSPHIGHO2_01_FULL_42_8]OGT53388.1 MAG: Dot/Icm secretion system protein IcmQ [Gammaproteobacteria bacterium RIFCSPHIGHO2_12_FULL_41_25]OGT63416.1 MAG: Dot/Icm secretion system protein IcmQ [Gammaproteobacteria bacterium RIFCSPLOWO2_02_FULL_42_14]OGT87342.1 MAG: Dot/Icm secretion system protein IcmQ [Gammap
MEKDQSSGITSAHKSQELKKRLLECIDKEAKHFSESTRAYFEKEELSLEDKTGLLQAVVAAVDHVLKAGDWDSSLFLRNLVKPLIAIKTEAQMELDRQHVKTDVLHIPVIAPPANDELQVYISLFQSDGYNMLKWAMQLRSLSRYVIGRPVYQNEADVEKWMRLRAGLPTEAYVAVIVKKSDIQVDPMKPALKDRYDHPLLELQETALQRGRIVSFVHQNIRYYFANEQLVKQG